MMKNGSKLWWATPLGICWAIWKERNRIVFEDAPFSHSRLKHSIISSLFFWTMIFPNVDVSFVKRLLNMYMSTSRC